MKALIILMLIFSLFTNVTTDIFGWVFLYEMEFSDAFFQIKSMHYDFAFCLFWVLLLFSHLGMIGLLFLTKQKSFRELIVWVPVSFLVFYIFYNLLSIFLLLPFIGVWLVAIFHQRSRKIKVKISIKNLLLLLILCSVFAAVPSVGWVLLQFKNDLSAAFAAIKAGENILLTTLWVALMLSDVALISLFFLRKRKSFKELLIWVPTLHLSLFVVYNYLAFFFLIPFIIIWAIALIKEKQQVVATRLTI